MSPDWAQSMSLYEHYSLPWQPDLALPSCVCVCVCVCMWDERAITKLSGSLFIVDSYLHNESSRPVLTSQTVRKVVHKDLAKQVKVKGHT